MKNRTLIIAVCLAAAALAGCGDGDADAASTTTTTTTSPPTTTSMVMTDGTMADMENGDGHSHEDGGATAEWDAGTPPTVRLAVAVEEDGGYLVTFDAPGFGFVSPTETEHVPGRGHTHVFVDGQLLGMWYEPEIRLRDLEPGMHEVRVVLSRADHLDYTADGELLAATTMIEVAGVPDAPDAAASVDFSGGTVTTADDRLKVPLGGVVELTFTSDVADEIHVHGYDIFGDLAPGQETVLRFTADIPGIFEVELEGSHLLLLELEVS